MQRVMVIAVLAASTVAASTASAQSKKGGKGAAGKNDARALLASGLKLFQAKDYLGALAVFKDAYARFPSAKILLNIGTTLKQLNRNAEAANTYQRYLDAADTDPAKRADVTKVLDELDAKVALVELTVTPGEAELQLAGSDAWVAAAELARVRVEPGKVTVRARHEGFQDVERSFDATAGGSTTLTLTLKAIEVNPPEPEKAPVLTGGDVDGGAVDTGPQPTRQRPSRLGAHVLAHVDVVNKGAAARVAATFEVVSRLHVEGGAIIGPASGAYAGVRYAVLSGTFRPLVVLGAPTFFEDGPRVAIRGAAGLEVVLSAHISAVLEVGVERVLNPGMNYVETMFVPAIGAAGRL